MRFHFKAKLYDIEIQTIPKYLNTGIERYEYVLKQLGFMNANGYIWNRYQTPVNSIDLYAWEYHENIINYPGNKLFFTHKLNDLASWDFDTFFRSKDYYFNNDFGGEWSINANCYCRIFDTNLMKKKLSENELILKLFELKIKVTKKRTKFNLIQPLKYYNQ